MEHYSAIPYSLAIINQKFLVNLVLGKEAVISSSSLHSIQMDGQSCQKGFCYPHMTVQQRSKKMIPRSRINYTILFHSLGPHWMDKVVARSWLNGSLQTTCVRENLHFGPRKQMVISVACDYVFMHIMATRTCTLSPISGQRHDTMLLWCGDSGMGLQRSLCYSVELQGRGADEGS